MDNKYGFIDLYFKDLDDSKFLDGKSQWEAWERFVDMLSMIALVNKEAEGDDCLDKVGCLLNDKDLMHTIEPHEKFVFPEWQKVRHIFATLLHKGDIKDINDDDEILLPMWQFLYSNNLKPIEIMAFILSACEDCNRKYERIFSILMEETNGVHKPTVGFVHDMCRFFLTEEERDTAILLSKESPLRIMLINNEFDNYEKSRMSTPIILNPRIILHIKGITSTGLGELGNCVEELPVFVEYPEFIIQQKLFDDGIDILGSVIGSKVQTTLFLEGEKGVGMSFYLQCLGSVSLKNILQVDFRKIVCMEGRELDEILSDIIWKSIFEQEIVFLDHFSWDREYRKNIVYILSRLQKDLIFFCIGGEKNSLFELPLKGQLIHRKINRPSANNQRKLWEIFAEEMSIKYSGEFLSMVVSKYNLTPGQIHNILSSAKMCAKYDAEDRLFLLTQEELEKEIRQYSAPNFGDNAVLLNGGFTMDELELPAESKEMLKGAINRILYRNRVLEDYGFQKKLPYGSGTSIVLYGPPGTGKTMTAQVLANELGLELYRVDISQISSKYIGETEKNLSNIFNVAEGTNAILFFDEADALFSKRTEVSSSNDKHANAEVAFLLQKIEAYTGISILATNGVQNFDAAFKRRMTYMIPVPNLTAEERLALWQKIFPEETPLEPDIDFELFAREAELSGSSIKSAALNAAFSAAAENRPVSNKDIAIAVNYESVKAGHMAIFNQLRMGV